MSNPAMTLYGHFAALQTIDQAQATWAKAWESTAGTKWTRAVGPLLGLIDETRRIVVSVPELDPTMLLHEEPQWRQLILLTGVNLNALMKSSGHKVDPRAVAALYGTATAITPYLTREPPEATITTLSTATDALHKAVLDADDLEPDLRLFLLTEVGRIRDALDRRRVLGAGAIEEAANGVAGSHVTNHGLWARVSMSPVAMRTHEWLLAVVGLITVVRGGVDALDGTVSSVSDLVNQIETFGDGPAALPPGS